MLRSIINVLKSCAIRTICLSNNSVACALGKYYKLKQANRLITIRCETPEHTDAHTHTHTHRQSVSASVLRCVYANAATVQMQLQFANLLIVDVH